MNNKLLQVLNEKTLIGRMIREYEVTIEEEHNERILYITKPIPVPNFLFVKKVIGRLTKIDNVIVGDGDNGTYE